MKSYLSDSKLAAIGKYCFLLGVPHIKRHPTSVKGSQVLEALKHAANTKRTEDLEKAQDLINQYNY
jgi:hypothetical protein